MQLVISMFVPGMPFDGNTLKERSLGGSETAGLCLARELAKLGHKVYMFSNCRESKIIDNVTYMPLEQYGQFSSGIPHDVTIVQRSPEQFTHSMSAKLKILWCHDLALGRQAGAFSGTLWNVDKVVVVSEWMRQQYIKTYGLEEDKVVVCRNGVDVTQFGFSEREDRNVKELVYTARPERGLDVLLAEVFPKVLERDPEVTLTLAAYDNQVPHLRDFYEQINALINRYGDKVNWAGALNKEDLAALYQRAGVYVYPTPSKVVNKEFAEVSCITALECMATGLPFVSSTRGALPETCGEASCLIDGDPNSEHFINDMVDEVLRLIGDSDYYHSQAVAGRLHIDKEGYDWWSGAHSWYSLIKDRFSEVNKDSYRLAKYFVGNSDIVAARYALETGVSSPNSEALKAHIQKHWGFASSGVEYESQYNKVAADFDDNFDGFKNEPRLAAVVEWLSTRDDIHSLVDIGCGMGVFSICLSNRFPSLKITGIDISGEAIDWARKYLDRYAEHPENLQFLVGTSELPVDAEFDCALAAEIVEHVPEPEKFIQEVESKVKTGGKVFLTVPFGPWEEMTYETYPHRCHFWNFEYFDILDMIGRKSDLSVQSIFCGVNDHLQAPLGHNLIHYTADHETVAPVDLGRKVLYQTPRQTLSVNIIAGPGCEETLHWCLRSVLPIANEIVIGDAGMSESARKILAEYDTNYTLSSIKVIKIDSPLDSGFDEARNALVRESTMDWILWIDTDEKLIEPTRMLKYLQSTGFNGYGIRQHHFSVDAGFSPDMPVRLFRRDKGLRFFGRIHEHPEMGLNEGPGPVVILSDVSIAHVGYLVESGRRQRFWRNHPLLQRDIKDYPERLLQKHFRVRDSVLLAGYHLQNNGGQVTQEVVDLCNEAISLTRKHFMGETTYVNIDTMQYYTRALEYLGEGIEAMFAISAKKHGVGEEVVEKELRYANVAEFKKDVMHRMDNTFSKFDNEFF